MRTKLALLFIFSLILTIFTPVRLSVAEEVVDTNDLSKTPARYPQDYVREYLQDCIQTAKEEGLVEKDAQTLCNCTLDKFQQKYTLTEFKQLTAASQTDDRAATSLIEVGELCLETILFQ
ncbi:MAG: hypothetical protein QNJ41_09665 [Xenococcaceae cyanobacterium MO_188.B32]|nr:hypothetical protein [Xenococcaceae cyanobacterium MO_188.B32]